MAKRTSREFLAHLGIGNTPLLDVSRLAGRGKVFLKAEFANPTGSNMDRTAAALVESARANGAGGKTLVASSSGNLGLALGAISQQTGTPVVVVMSADPPPETAAQICASGVRLKLSLPGPDPARSRHLMAQAFGDLPGYVWLDQFGDRAATAVHAETTGPEIFEQAGVRVDAVVGSVGTGATMCGVAQHIRSAQLGTKTIAVRAADPAEVNGGDSLDIEQTAIGPTDLLRRDGHLIDAVATVTAAGAAWFAQGGEMETGHQMGPGSGSALAVAVRYAEQHDATVVAIATDTNAVYSDLMRSLAGPINRITARQAVTLGANPSRATLKLSLARPGLVRT